MDEGTREIIRTAVIGEVLHTTTVYRSFTAPLGEPRQAGVLIKEKHTDMLGLEMFGDLLGVEHPALDANVRYIDGGHPTLEALLILFLVHCTDDAAPTRLWISFGRSAEWFFLRIRYESTYPQTLGGMARSETTRMDWIDRDIIEVGEVVNITATVDRRTRDGRVPAMRNVVQTRARDSEVHGSFSEPTLIMNVPRTELGLSSLFEFSNAFLVRTVRLTETGEPIESESYGTFTVSSLWIHARMTHKPLDNAL
jgi:hypothetical protein